MEKSVVEKFWPLQHRQEMPTCAQLFHYDLSVPKITCEHRGSWFPSCFECSADIGFLSKSGTRRITPKKFLLSRHLGPKTISTIKDIGRSSTPNS